MDWISLKYFLIYQNNTAMYIFDYFYEDCMNYSDNDINFNW